MIYKGVISSIGQGPLTPGVEGNTIGPEIGFGWVMGYFHDEPVLLIKASIGNRGLVWDFAPPGSKRFTYDGKVYAGYKDSPASWPEGTEPKPINWYAGKQYDDCVKATHEVLDNFDKLFPQFKAEGYEIAGFVWWQGEKDSHVDAWAAHYEETLVRFIKSIRTEFKAPKMPVVVATIGFGGKDMQDSYKRIWQAQMNVGNAEKYPQYVGNLAVVDTRPFWRSVEESPRAQGYHYNRNAGTYVQVGEAIGRAMVKLEEGK